MTGGIIPGYEPKSSPISLVDATIYVPNRRAARALSTTFLTHLDGKAALLPKIRTLGDADDDEFGISTDLTDLTQDGTLITPLQRKLKLANLVRYWKDQIAEETRRLYGDEDVVIPSNPADSMRLAEDLAELLNQITQEEARWNAIQSVVPEEHAEWWRLTTTFLKIVMEHWPQILTETIQVEFTTSALD